MKKITVPGYDQVSTGSQQLFDTLKARVGKVPNLYATMGHSEHGLKAFMALDDILSQGVFTAVEREAIALVVSEVNQCEYCLAGHTLLAIKKGLTKEQTFEARKGKMTDPKLNAIVSLAKSVTINKGNPDEHLVENFYNAGFNEGAAIELIGLVTVRIYTNYVFAFAKIPVDFPLAEPIE